MNEFKMVEWVKQLAKCTDHADRMGICEEVWRDGYDTGWEENDEICVGEPIPWHELD